MVNMFGQSGDLGTGGLRRVGKTSRISRDENVILKSYMTVFYVLKTQYYFILRENSTGRDLFIHFSLSKFILYSN